MTIEDKLLLIKAGYMKTDIESMEGKAKPNPKQETTKESAGESKKHDPVTLTWDQLTQLINTAAKQKSDNELKTKPETKPETKQETKLAAMTPEQYSQLLQAINRGTAHIDVPPTKEENINNMLGGRLKAAFTSQKGDN